MLYDIATEKFCILVNIISQAVIKYINNDNKKSVSKIDFLQWLEVGRLLTQSLFSIIKKYCYNLVLAFS